MNITKIPLDRVLVGKRLREVDQDKAELIAASFREIGQTAPIDVRKEDADGKFTLIAGAHRLRAAELAGLKTINAIVRTVTNTEAELMEIDENLLRADLCELDRCVFLERRKRLYELKHPETAHGGDRRSDQFAKFCDLRPERFTADTAERLGLSERSVQLAVKRATAIAESARRALSGTAMANSGVELDALLKFVDDDGNPLEDQQLQAIGLVTDGTEQNLRRAAARLRGEVKAEDDPQARLFDQFKRLWSKADRHTREQIKRHMRTAANRSSDDTE